MYESVAIYVRLSDEDRDKEGSIDSRSIQNQKSLLIDYAQKQCWNIYNIYSDDDYSGGDRNRPEWNKMLNDCKDGKIDIVLCKSQSRFSREIAVVEEYINDRFQEWGVRFIGLVDNADTSIPSNRKSRQINGLVNEWYLEDCSQNVRKVLRHKAENGEFVGAFAPYGYKKDPNDKHKLIIDPEAAKVVQRIFHDYVYSSGTVSIVKRLNAEGIVPPSVYKSQHSNSKNYYSSMLEQPDKRKVWTPSTVTRMIVNQVYIGNMVQGKHHNLSYKNHKKVCTPKEDWVVVEGTHEAIIDKKTWDLAQEKRKGRCREGNRIGSPTPLTKKLFCSKCGSYMMRSVSRRTYGKQKYRYVSCSTRRAATTCDNLYYISYDYVEQYILNEINKILHDYYDEKEIVLEEHKNIISNQIKKLKTSISKIEKQIESKNDVIYSLYQDKVSGLISSKQFIEFKTKTENELKNLNKKLNQSNNFLSSLVEKSQTTTKKDNILSKYKQISELTIEVVDEFIEKILLDKEKDGTVNIEIFWKI